MKINDKYFSLPPYISTQWNYVKGLYMRGGSLVINLNCGETIQIPGLQPEIVEQIFAAHALFLEQEVSALGTFQKTESFFPSQGLPPFPSKEQMETLFHIQTATSDGVSSLMQHCDEQRDAPELPAEILKKIKSIMQIISPSEALMLPSPEYGCNCPHCQITRAVQVENESTSSIGITDDDDDEEEIVGEEELLFQPWKINQIGENLYTVTSKLEPINEYRVFLGTPVGCTCGSAGCDHILAVLKS